MGQVKIWLNSQPDISEMPKFLLLIMIIITVFFCDPLWLLRSHIFWSVGSFFAYNFHLVLLALLLKKALLLHCSTQRRVMYSVWQNKGRSLS